MQFLCQLWERLRGIYSEDTEKFDIKCSPRAQALREVYMALNFLWETSALAFETQVH